MARLRIRLEVKRAEKGVPLDKLAEVAGEAQKLIRLIGRDAALKTEGGYWIARNFYEGSLGFDVEYLGEVDDAQAKAYTHAFQRVASYKPDGNGEFKGVPADTIVQYARVAEAINPGESIRFGLFDINEERPTWSALSKQESVLILDHFETTVEYHGMVQGIIHSLYKEANPPYFDLRELSTERLVKCLFSERQYATVIGLLKKKDAVVLVSGLAKTSRLSRKIEALQIEKMEVTEPLSGDEYEKFFGCAPGLTGRLTTSEFIDRVRRDGE